MNTELNTVSADRPTPKHPDWSGKAAEPAPPFNFEKATESKKVLPGIIQAVLDTPAVDCFGGNHYPLGLMDIMAERCKQDREWGVQMHNPARWFIILGEEFGEVAKALNENDTDGYRDELVDVAAVALAAIEEFDRRRANLADQQVHY